MSWIFPAVAAIAVAFGISRQTESTPQPYMHEIETAYVEPDIGEPETFSLGSSGSALASAAFGLDALQPETYNGEIVLDIIDASPLARAEKRRLTAGLAAAEAGRADLQRVLTDVRVSLAVE